MLKQIIEPLGTLTSIFHHYFFQIFPPFHKPIVLLKSKDKRNPEKKV
jgi:hypothetical protein